jgi:hypothetical protein
VTTSLPWCKEIVFPDFIQVLREVSGDELYENRSLAENVPNEDQPLLY